MKPALAVLSLLLCAGVIIGC